MHSSHPNLCRSMQNTNDPLAQNPSLVKFDVPVCHYHTLLPAQDELFPSFTRDFSIERLSECQSHIWPVFNWRDR